MSDPQDIIDLTGCAQRANLTMWIGKGKTYPDNPPADLKEYVDSMTLISTQYEMQLRIVEDELSPLALIHYQLPPISNSLITRKAKNCFSTRPATEDPLSILERGAPSKEFIEQAKAAFGQAILDGSCSLEDPNFKGRPLPLWSVTAWGRIHGLREGQSAWRRSVDWLKKNTQGSRTRLQAESQACLRLLEGLGWLEKMRLKAVNESLQLTQMLSNQMVEERIVDVMVAWVLDNIEKGVVDDILGDLCFMDFIHKSWDARNTKTVVKQTPFVTKILQEMKQDPRTLLFPVHLKSTKHFVGFAIDFDREIIFYGDSLNISNKTGGSEIGRTYQRLQWWLQANFGKKFADMGCTLERGIQQDACSCAFATVNMFTHRILGDPVWHSSQAEYDRIRWCNRLLKWHFQVKHHPPPTSSGPELNRNTSQSQVISHTSPAIANLLSGPEGPPPISTTSGRRLRLEDLLCNPTPAGDHHKSNGSVGLDVQPKETHERSTPSDATMAMDVDVPWPDVAMTDEFWESATKATSANQNTAGEFFKLEKRKREDLVGKDVDDVEDGKEEAKRKKASRGQIDVTTRNIGISQSARRSREANEDVKNGTFKLNKKKWEDFQRKIREIDPQAGFSEHKPKSAKCSQCDTFYEMKAPYNISYFEKHFYKCPNRGKKRQGITPTLTSLFAKQAAAKKDSQPVAAPQSSPCPGLTASDHKDIPRYLDRTPATGGGAPRVDLVALSINPKCPYRDLSEAEKASVQASQRQLHRWKNDVKGRCVYSTLCKKVARVTFQHSRAPCMECAALLQDRAFLNLLKRRTPDEKNIKFTPKIHIDDTSVEKWARINGVKEIIEACKTTPNAPCLLFAQKVLQKKFENESLFLGLVEAMVSYKDREERGVGLQNMKYIPEVAEFAQIVNILSPRAYRAIKDTLHLPSERVNQINRAREPRFEFGVTDKTFERIVGLLKPLDWASGKPVAISCDDTALSESLQPFYDKATKQFHLLGAACGNPDSRPMVLAEPEKFAEILAQGKIAKASKLRLFVLQVPMPKAPTIIAAALTISNKASADQLYPYLTKLLDGLIERGILVVSYAADGSAVERAIQHKLLSSCDRRTIFSIKHPFEGRTALSFSIPFYGQHERPIAILQDSQHALKTFRNAACSGTKVLTLGNYVVHYGQLRRIHTKGGPLFASDIIKMDRQDDAAAIRLFSAATLEWLKNKYPTQLGTILFLFIFGELIDAFQNRHLSHVERLKMVFRALFFLEIWEEFIHKAGYQSNQHFLSKESCDILKFLIHGYVALVIIYRDHLPQNYPLVIWLLFTEACEHLFGLCRQIQDDFSALDFIYMVPKLAIRLREIFSLRKDSNGKERASGYSHTYHDIRDLDINALSTFPTNIEMEEAAQIAGEEAREAWFWLGYSPSTFDTASGRAIAIPSIASWFREPVTTTPQNTCKPSKKSAQVGHGDEGGINDDDKHGDDDGDDDDDDDDDCEEECSLSSQISGMFSYLETFDLTFDDQDTVNSLAFAATALTVNDSLRILELSDLAEEQTRPLSEPELRQELQRSLDLCLPAVNAPQERHTVLDISKDDLLDLNHMVTLRFNHQRKQALTGVRIHVPPPTTISTDSSPTSTTNSVDSQTEVTQLSRRELLRQLEAVVKAQEEKGVTSSVGRQIRYGYFNPGRRPTGNAANAAEVAGTRASKLGLRRVAAFNKHLSAALRSVLGTGGVSGVLPLAFYDEDSSVTMVDGSLKSGMPFGFVLVNGCIMLAKVLCIFTKTGAKNAKHAWTDAVDSIATVSNLSLQLYHHFSHRKFLDRHATSTSSLVISRFAQRPSIWYLYSLGQLPKVKASDGFVEINDRDYALFQQLQTHVQNITAAVKTFNGKKDIAKDASDDENDV